MSSNDMQVEARTLYVAGPMTGLPDFNYPAFFDAESDLSAKGYRVLNPARREARDDWGWIDYMRPALIDVAACDGIATLSGWYASRGARIEVHVAASLGLPVAPLADWLFGLVQEADQ